MPTTRRRATDDDDDFDERGLLKDGRTLSVPLTMMDAAFEADLAEKYPSRAGHKSLDRRIIDSVLPPDRRDRIPPLSVLMDASSPEHDALVSSATG